MLVLIVAACTSGSGQATTSTSVLGPSVTPSSITASPILRVEAFLVSHPCWFTLAASNQARSMGLVIEIDADRTTGLINGISSSGEVDADAWSGTVRFGADLFANWCDDVIDPGEGTPRVDEEWPIVGGSVRIVEFPENGRGTVLALASDLVMRRPDGSQTELGDLELKNEDWGRLCC